MINTLFKSKSSYELDKLCVSRGLNFSKLMENASTSAFSIIDEKVISNLKNFNQKILILCGPGNNGGDEIVRYDQVDLKETVKELTDGKGVDIVIDPVGGAVSEQALRATAFNGRLLVIGFANGEIPKISLNLTLVKGVSIVGVWWGRWTNTSPHETAEDFSELVSFVESGELNIVPKNNYKIENTSIALENFLNRKNIGKTVISV